MIKNHPGLCVGSYDVYFGHHKIRSGNHNE